MNFIDLQLINFGNLKSNKILQKLNVGSKLNLD